MKSVDLHKVWGKPDNTRLTAKQQSFRLPVHVAAKISALCELYPHRTKTEIVGDLLATALEDAIAGLCWTQGRPIGRDPDTDEEMYEGVLTHEGTRFQDAANKHFRTLERELGNKTPPDLYPKSKA